MDPARPGEPMEGRWSVGRYGSTRFLPFASRVLSAVSDDYGDDD